MINTALAARLLQTAQPAQVPAMILRSARVGPSYRRGQDAVDAGLRPNPGPRIDDAGMFGGPATLPANPGPPEPGILPGADLPNAAFTGPPRGGGGGTEGLTVEAGSMNSGSFGPIPGEHWLGGSFTGIDRNTGRPIYNPLGYGSMSGLASFGAFGSMSPAAAAWENSWGSGPSGAAGGNLHPLEEA